VARAVRVYKRRGTDEPSAPENESLNLEPAVSFWVRFGHLAKALFTPPIETLIVGLERPVLQSCYFSSPSIQASPCSLVACNIIMAYRYLAPQNYSRYRVYHLRKVKKRIRPNLSRFSNMSVKLRCTKRCQLPD
jgi:hypothetical protein